MTVKKQKSSLSHLFYDAVAFAQMGYFLLRLPDRTVRESLKMKYGSLESFEPRNREQESTTPPYWQNLVFSDGRAEKLLKRLEGIPQIDPESQKICLSQSMGGLRILPAHRELIKYGLTDACLQGFGHIRIHDQSGETTRNANAGLIMDKNGIYTADENKIPIIEQGHEKQYQQMNLKSEIYSFTHNVHCSPYPVEILNNISQAIYAWVFEDVLPVIPNFLTSSLDDGYKAIAQDDGSFRLERHPKDYTLGDPVAGKDTEYPPGIRLRKSLYAILADGYTGTLPAATTVTPQIPQP